MSYNKKNIKSDKNIADTFKIKWNENYLKINFGKITSREENTIEVKEISAVDIDIETLPGLTSYFLILMMTYDIKNETKLTEEMTKELKDFIESI